MASQSKSTSSFHYVYLLASSDRKHRYVGITRDLESRLRKHNAGEVSHTSKYKPWRLETAIAFRDKEKAYAYERYLKSHSGREYSNTTLTKLHNRQPYPPTEYSRLHTQRYDPSEDLPLISPIRTHKKGDESARSCYVLHDEKAKSHEAITPFQKDRLQG